MLTKIIPTTVAVLLLAASAAAPAQASGAIVSSPIKGKYYYMTHRPSPAFAAGLAMADCESHYVGGCHVLAAFASGCIAIAHGGGHSGWAVKSSPGAATGWALAQCQKYGVACDVDVAKCE